MGYNERKICGIRQAFSSGTFYFTELIFEIPQNGIETLKLVPVAKTSYAVDTITEELIDETLEWNDFETIEKAV